ncbi:MAG: C40 family peptidase [Flavobacteriaceae bacterium]|nr:C40 family peptidase [Flavobacteriaceae bacterium]
MGYKKIIFFSVFISLLSCKKNTDENAEFDKIYNNIKNKYAPDKRVELFNINFSKKNDNLILSGETTTKIAVSILVDSLKLKNETILNKIRVLPDSAVGSNSFAIARNSVINIRSNPKHSAELGTQGLLGMPLKVLDKKGDFYRVQTPDKYISWVDKGGITRMNKSNFDNWNASKKVIFTENFGNVYSKKDTNSSIVSDISLGGVLQYLSEDNNFFEVKYPDNRIGYISKNEALVYDSWLLNTSANPNNIEHISKTMLGFPYLWGGTSAKGMDCSGFTKMVYLMNGFIIPRDASQQINAGIIVDENLTFDGLQKGDLLFFGKKATEKSKQRVTHVGIWLGNNEQEFIHASGNVHISSMKENHPLYDEFNKNRYLGSRRYLGVKDDLIIDLKKKLKE